MTTTIDRPAKKPRGKKPSRPSSANPVTQYALDVTSGTIVAGRAVRLACDRHLRDLTRERTAAFPFYFDRNAAQHIIDFFPEFLTLENGEPFRLVGWQAFCLGSVFGWKRASDGYRRFQTAYVETGKGSGKSPLLAGIGLYGLAFDDEPAAEIYSAAFDRDQASIILNDAIRMAEGSPDLCDLLDIGKYNLAHIGSGSFFRAVSSEHRSKSGPRPHFVLIDEEHEHRDGTVVNKMRAGFKGRKQPLLFVITNSGHDRTSICWQHHQHSLSILETTVSDDQWFAYVCQLDACEACFAEGHRQPKDGCADCDDWTDAACWPKANPSLGVTIQESYLRTQVDLAIAMPSDQALTKRLNFCLWTETHQVWISADRWDACRVAQVAANNATAKPCAAGMDLSSKMDLSAFVIAIRHDDPPKSGLPEVVEIEGKDADGASVIQTITLDFSVELVPFFWMPKETLRERVQKERISFDVWERNGHVFATPGPVIDHQAIYDFIVKDAWKRYKIQRLGYDPKDATMLAVALRDRGRLGDAIVEVGQKKRLSEAYKLIEVLARSGRLWHDGHPVLAWCVANGERHEDSFGAVWVEKPSDHKRIDGAVAAAMAIKELMVLPAQRKKSAGAWLL